MADAASKNDATVPVKGEQRGKSSSVTPKGAEKPKQAQRTGSGGRKQKKTKSCRSEQRAALQAAKKKGREKHGQGGADTAVQMAGLVLDDSPPPRPIGTGLVYDERFKEHYCPIGSDHGKSECPERYSTIMERLHGRGLVDRCVRVPVRSASEEEILSLHSSEYLETLKKSSTLSPEDLQNLAESYDSVFMCKESFDVVRLGAGGLLELTEKVIKGELRNGFSVGRPPGHHAQNDLACGYSLLNNVALAAKLARTKWNVDRVLIVDWDIHHGQGTQYLFEDDPSVLYFSMHRYENMAFWPHLEESNYDRVGKGAGQGFNVNIPWNKIGMGDSEYLAVFQQLLLPLAYEFNPELILVSAGFDSAIGDPKGEMTVSPTCFAHLTHQLMGVAQGKVVLNLEGGYCLEVLGECAAMCTTALLGDPFPPLPLVQPLSDSAIETLMNVTQALKPHWKCLQWSFDSESQEEPVQSGDISSTTPEVPCPQGEGAECRESVANVDQVTCRLLKELMLSAPPHRTGLVYDDRMMLHRTFDHPERPERIARIYTKHKEHGLVDRCHRIEGREVTEEELLTCHLPAMVDDIKETSKHTARELIDIQDKFNTLRWSRDIYIHPDTFKSASVAAGCCLNLVDAVLTNKVLNAVGIVRPPGHHADSKMVSGFCIFNNVAIASKYAQDKYGVKRILIVDWDVHHGNGTQRIFENDPSVLYISLHRHEDGTFYPPGPEGAADHVGKGKGTGYNVNIGWNTDNRGGMGDAEYLAAFHHVVMPLAYQFNPELVFISAGFDAAKGDPLGGCLVSPEGYGHMTHMLSSLAGGRVITVLEGGYNLHSIAVSMAMCTRVMLGDPCPYISPRTPSCFGLQAIYDAAKAHETFWPAMKTLVNLLDTLLCVKDSSEEDTTQTDSPAADDVKAKDTERVEEVSSTQASASAAIKTSDPHPGDTSGEKEEKRGDGGVEGILEGMSEMSIGNQPEAMSAANEDAALGACGLSDGAGPSQGPNIKDVVSSLSEAFGSDVQMHAVIPQPWCPHLETGVAPLPPGGLDTSMPCQDCGAVNENWVCLQCYKVFCGRYVSEHMLMHGLETNHLMVLSYADLSAWCYGCEAYIHNEVLIPAKRAAHISKFGEDVPGM